MKVTLVIRLSVRLQSRGSQRHSHILDRILSRCNPQDMRPVSIELVGNRDEDAVCDNSLHPSDHFGLIAVFDV